MRETRRAEQAFEDYYNMGPGRSFRALLERYRQQTDTKPPTKRLKTINDWSVAHGWQERVAERDAELAQIALDELKEKAKQTGYALEVMRIAHLNDIAMELFGQIKDEEKLWLRHYKSIGADSAPEPVQIFKPVFNEAILRQYRGLLEDISSEVGGRAKREKEPPEKSPVTFFIPADMLAPEFLAPYRDIRNHLHTEYLFYGGRGSTKSSFVSEISIELLINNPDMHMLACRQVGNTLRDSVYSQLQWAINELGLSDSFKCITNPLEIEYLPTGQKIYFRGADDAAKIKSIKPPFGYIGILWFEELDQFKGSEAIRKIEQSAIRGGDIAYIFKSFNPPRTANNWANQYIRIPKKNQYQHFSNYKNVPREWLGQAFIDEAEHLKVVNPAAYEHEYGGIANGTGGQVFENVIIRKITDEEIYGTEDEFGRQVGGFDHILHGLDWGYFPDPLSYGRMHYDAARMTLYIYGEYRAHKKSNRQAYDALVELGLRPNDLIIADSAEPKSIGDFRAYGANIRGAEKGPDSVDYSMKWLQSLAAIVIDNERAPYHAEEFLAYELEQDKNGEFISSYPDRDNHAIDDVRYATNLIWRQRGK